MKVSFIDLNTFFPSSLDGKCLKRCHGGLVLRLYKMAWNLRTELSCGRRNLQEFGKQCLTDRFFNGKPVAVITLKQTGR